MNGGNGERRNLLPGLAANDAWSAPGSQYLLLGNDRSIQQARDPVANPAANQACKAAYAGAPAASTLKHKEVVATGCVNEVKKLKNENARLLSLLARKDELLLAADLRLQTLLVDTKPAKKLKAENARLLALVAQKDELLLALRPPAVVGNDKDAPLLAADSTLVPRSSLDSTLVPRPLVLALEGTEAAGVKRRRKERPEGTTGGICEHQRRRSRCIDCGGSGVCIHKKRKSQCKDCGGGELCEHKRQRNQCKECGGSSICVHKQVRSQCKECGGSSICVHKRRKHQCKECRSLVLCIHKREKSECPDCRPPPPSSPPPAGAPAPPSPAPPSAGAGLVGHLLQPHMLLAPPLPPDAISEEQAAGPMPMQGLPASPHRIITEARTDLQHNDLTMRG